eukprot:1161394-Pelagomonas_calceolata.AAC.2
MEIWCQKVGFTPQLIWHVPPNWLISNPSATEFRNRLSDEPKLGTSQLRGKYVGEHAKKGNFRPQIALSGIMQHCLSSKHFRLLIKSFRQDARQVNGRKEGMKKEKSVGAHPVWCIKYYMQRPVSRVQFESSVMCITDRKSFRDQEKH